MNIAHIEQQSFIYGPGCRFVIWVQGCSIRCKGCWNQQMWSFDHRDTYSVEQLTDMILSEKEYIEGITILGGEPFDQFSETLLLCQKCQKLGFSTMVFTGYELSEIENSEKSAIKSFADILITGRYIESLRTTNLQWIGSTNQQILFLSDKYKDYTLKDANYIEIDIENEGKCTILGFPDRQDIKEIF